MEGHGGVGRAMGSKGMGRGWGSGGVGSKVTGWGIMGVMGGGVRGHGGWGRDRVKGYWVGGLGLMEGHGGWGGDGVKGHWVGGLGGNGGWG